MCIHVGSRALVLPTSRGGRVGRAGEQVRMRVPVLALVRLCVHACGHEYVHVRALVCTRTWVLVHRVFPNVCLCV